MGASARLVAIGLSLLLAVTACGRALSPGEGGATSTPAPDSPVVGTPDDTAPVEPTPEIVTPRPGMVDVHPVAWESIAMADDDRTLTVFFWGGVEPCYVLDRVEVSYGAQDVTITLFQGHEPDPGEDVACIEIALYKAVVVELREPLAGRTLVDGSQAT